MKDTEKETENQETKTDYLEIVDNISETLGSKDDKEIDTALLNLAEIKEYLSTIKEKEEEYVQRESEQNETIINLRKANNKLMRQVATKDDVKEKIDEEAERIDILNKIF